MSVTIPKNLGILAIALATIAVPTLRAEEPKELLDRMEKKMADAKSYEMVVELTSTSDQMEAKTVSKMWYTKTADGYKQRIETQMNMTMPGMPAQSNESLVVSDGKTTWMQSSQAGQTMVIKQNADKDPMGMGQIRDQLGQGKATVKPSETIDGETHAVLELITDMAGETMTSTYWFNEKTGMMTKMEGKHPIVGKTLMKATEVKINPSIPDDKFAYTPPAGAEIQDMTSGG